MLAKSCNIEMIILLERRITAFTGNDVMKEALLEFKVANNYFYCKSYISRSNENVMNAFLLSLLQLR